MLRVVAHTSAAAALKYYSEGLRQEDYYAEGMEKAGLWHGKGAELLGLTGPETPEAFAALLENRHPETGAQLTPRMRDGRRVGYDLNFHAPKSLSLLQALTGDKRIVEAFRAAVVETMGDIEALASTRVRRGGAQTERRTGNLVWAEFVHFTSRPVDGVPCPHLHVHAFAPNVTFDETENRWKAASWADIKSDAPYHEWTFHARLALKMADLGYAIDRTADRWEVAGISRELIEKFSERTAQIERLAQKLGIKDAKAKDALGAKSREGKRHGMTEAELLAAWESRLTAPEAAQLASARREKGGATKALTAKEAVAEACEKVFAKASVVESRRLIAQALRFGVGSVSPADAWREFERRKMVVRKIGNQHLCTTLEVLAEEVALINQVRSGLGRYAPMSSRPVVFENQRLSREQKEAVRHVLESHNQVTGIRGLAGAGKTTTMMEVVSQIQNTGRKVFAFAPSADASRGTLREVGIQNAQTVAHLLANPNLQLQTRGQVIWIDEAGQIGAHDLWRIMQLVGESTRVILTGDTGQHAPVPRGDAFRLLQHYAGLKVAVLREIRRQNEGDYRKAVTALSMGDLKTGIRRLDDLNAIVEIANATERYQQLAQDYLALSYGNRVPLVVSPTHAEGALVTEALRQAKQEAGLLGAEQTFLRYEKLHWEAPDRRRTENYEEGMVIQFTQNVKGFKRGEVFRFARRDKDGGVLIENSGGVKSLPLQHADRFLVFETRELQLAKGDRIRITMNGKSDDGRRLNNGDVFTIADIGHNGIIKLNTGATLTPEHGHFTYGYCQTSHGTQSKTTRDVLIAQSSDSFSASSREQFYVSVSRGKETIRIYTDSRRELEAAVGVTSTRRAAIELTGLTKEEVSALVSDTNGADYWRNKVRKHEGEETAKSQLEKLLSARKIGDKEKAEAMDFRQYLAMKEGLKGPDGNSRSKGRPNFDRKPPRSAMSKGLPFPTPEHRQSTREKLIAANEKKHATEAKKSPPAGSRRERLAENFKAVKARFGKAIEKAKGKVTEFRDKAFPKRDAAQAARNAERRVTEPPAKKKTQAKTPTKPKAPTPPRPGPRKGR